VEKSSDSWQVLVDGIELCCCTSVPMALGLYFVAFYILNLCFMKNSFRMLTFLQKYAFHINDPTSDMQVKRAQRLCMALMEKLSINGRCGPRTSVVKSKMSRSLAKTSGMQASVSSAASSSPASVTSAARSSPVPAAKTSGMQASVSSAARSSPVPAAETSNMQASVTSAASSSQMPDGTNIVQGKRARRKTAGKGCKKWKYQY